MKKIYFLLFFVAVLGGCGSLETQFKQASEPMEDQPRARLRIIANSLVKAVPGKSCIDWSSPGAGTVFGGGFGSSGYKGRTLNMPYPPNVKKSEMGELYVSADKPLTLAFLTTPEGISSGGRTYHCQVSGTFIPGKDKDYEASLILDPAKSQCFFGLTELGENRSPVPITSASLCK